MSHETFVIVGANLAGGRAAEALRKSGFEGRIVLLGKEPERPYDRPPLSKKFARGLLDEAKLYFRPLDYYETHRIELELGVTATGLELQLMSNLPILLDGIPVDASKSLSYRGMMFSGIPNLVSSFGYTNASWTLRSELTARYVCRLLSYMRRRGYRQCLPRPSAASGPSRPLVGLSSGYVARGAHRFPRQGSGSPWQVRQNYLLDWL